MTGPFPPSIEPLVHVVDDDPAVLESIGWLLKSMDIAYRAYASADAFLAQPDYGCPGCVILDVRMPGMSGLELQDFLNAGQIEIPIIFISGHSDVPVAVRAMKHGAVEFLPKPFAQQDLLEAVDKALATDRQRRQKAAADQNINARLGALSPREREVLLLLVEGHSAKEVGKKLSISPRTVEFHRNKVLEKTNATSLVALATEIGRLKE